MAKSKKRKPQHRNPSKPAQAKNIEISKKREQLEQEIDSYEIPHRAPKPTAVKQKSDKPLYLRIIMIAIAAAMVIGIVVQAVAGLIVV